MKIIRLFLNILLFGFVFCITTAASIGVYSAISYQSSDDYAIIEFPTNDENVSYVDSVLYWYDDISTNIVQTDEVDTKMRVADWFDWQWWKNSMKYVDMYFVDPVVDLFKPIILPISCIEEIRMYYGKDISDFEDYINRDTKSVTDFAAMSAMYFGVSVGFDESGVNKINSADLEENRNAFSLEVLMRDNDENGITDLFDVSGHYDYYYQLLYKLDKYNQVDENGTPVYEKYFNKFIFEDAAGRHIKSSVYSLYVIELVALFFAIFFVFQNPIALHRNEAGFTEFKAPIRGFGRKRKRKIED